MPVRITTKLGESDPRAISAAQLSVGRVDFNQHYCKASLPTPQVLPTPELVLEGQINKISWNSLFAAVEAYREEWDVAAEDVALRFVHCFEEGSGSLYHRLQLLKMGPPHYNAEGRKVRTLDATHCAWYAIKDLELSPTEDDTLTDTLYVNSIMYKPAMAAASMQLIEQHPHKFVHNLTFPWSSEILLMYLENQSPESADINFAVYTHIMSNPMESHCEFPHGMVIYLSVGTYDYIDNEHYITVFHNRGADMGTMCPPTCNVYVVPHYLPGQ